MHHHSLPLHSSSFTTSRGVASSHANSPVSSLLLILLTLKIMEEPLPTSHNASTSPPPRDQRADSPPPSSLDYDVVVIMAAMICALVCALGLNSMLRCVVRCTRHALTEPVGWVAQRRANAGLKREDVVALPIATYAAPPLQSSSSSGSPAPQPPGCAICLSDFADGDKIRLLPACGHRFHVVCIDTWLLSRCSCPTCRHRLLSAQGIAEGSPLDV